MSQRNSFRSFVQDVGWATTSTIFLTIAGFVLNVLLGNLFGEDGLGLYSLLATLYLAMGTLASVGLPGALTKYAAEFADESGIGREFYTAALLLALAFGLAGSTIVLILRGWVASVFHMPDLAGLLSIVALGLPAFELNKIVLARLRGMRRVRAFSIGESSRYLFLIVFTIGLVSWQRNLAAATWALVLAEGLLLAVLWSATKLPQSLSLSNLGQRSRELSWFGGQVLLARLMVELDARLDLLLAGYFLTEADVGIYAVAIMFAHGLKVLPTAFQKVTGPVITQTYTKRRVSSLERFVNRTMQVTMFLLTLITVPLVVLFPQIVKLLYPGQDAFLGAQAAFNVLIVGFLFRGVSGSVGTVFVSVGRPDITFKVAPVRLLVNFVVSVALVGTFGISGIAAGAAAAALLVFALWTGLMSRVVGIRIDYKPLLAIPALGAVALLTTYMLSAILPTLAALVISLAAFGLVTTRLWHFEQYLFRLWRPALGTE